MSFTINNTENRDQLLNFVVVELKNNGIKYRKEPPVKHSKKHLEKITYGKVFNTGKKWELGIVCENIMIYKWFFCTALEYLDTVSLDNGKIRNIYLNLSRKLNLVHFLGISIPTFVVNACKRILAEVTYEGIFRKTGSTKRQKEIIVSHQLLSS